MKPSGTNLPPTIPSDREGRYSFLHRVFIITGVLGRLSPIVLLPAWTAMIAVACWPWRASQLLVAGLVALMWASDWGALWPTTTTIQH